MKKTASIILAAGLVFIGAPAMATEGHDQDTKTMKWFLPDGGTPQNVTWPQPIFTNQCDGWVQVDVYPYGTGADKARTDALDDDGVLSYGEDHGWVKSWSFEQAPACPEPTPKPTDPPTEEPTSTPTDVPETPASPVTPPVTLPPSPSPEPPVESSPEIPVTTLPSSPVSVPNPVGSESPTPSDSGPNRTELAETGISLGAGACLAGLLVGIGLWLKRRSRSAW